MAPKAQVQTESHADQISAPDVPPDSGVSVPPPVRTPAELLAEAKQAITDAEQRLSVAEQWLTNTNAVVEAAESAYLRNQTDAHFTALEDAKRAHTRAELDHRAAKTALHSKRVAAWQVKQDDIDARIAKETAASRSFASDTKPDIDRLAKLLAEYSTIVQSICEREAEGRAGLQRANNILRDEEFYHRVRHPDYVDPSTRVLPPGVSWGTIDDKPPRETVKYVTTAPDTNGYPEAYIKQHVQTALNIAQVRLWHRLNKSIP